MGRYLSDSEDERKKRKKKKKKRSRSRSRSGSVESRHSTKQKKSKKSKKKHRSRSRGRSSDRYKRSRSSRSRSSSRSYDRYRNRSRTRSRSRSRDRYRRRSRSFSRDRFSRSRSRDRRRRRSRSGSRSRSYERSRRSKSYSPPRKDRKKESSGEREDPCSSIPGFAEMTPADQARIRMHMALKAAAAADEKLKGEMPRSQSSVTLQESLKFSQAIQDIESSGFAATSFKSSRGDKREETVTVKDEFLFGTAGELRLDASQRKPVIVNVDTDELAHPSLYADPEEKLDRWIQKLTAMRRKKLEGEALT